MTSTEFLKGWIKKGRFFGNQYLYVVSDLTSLHAPVFDQSAAVDFPSDFLKGLDLKDKSGHNRTHVCVWGGASKRRHFLFAAQTCRPTSRHRRRCEPSQARKVLPATGLKVVSPEMGLADLPGNSLIYVMNSNYLQEIKEMSHNKFHYIGIDQ